MGVYHEGAEAMIQLLAGILPGLFKLGDKLIVDKDKKAEFAFKVQEMSQELAFKLLDTKTYPWVDALVKLAYASERIIKGLFRPLVSGGLLVYALWNPDVLDKLQSMGAVGELAIAAIFGAFPGWMVSRHAEKKRKQKVAAFDDEEDW